MLTLSLRQLGLLKSCAELLWLAMHVLLLVLRLVLFLCLALLQQNHVLVQRSSLLLAGLAQDLLLRLWIHANQHLLLLLRQLHPHIHHEPLRRARLFDLLLGTQLLPDVAQVLARARKLSMWCIYYSVMLLVNGLATGKECGWRMGLTAPCGPALVLIGGSLGICVKGVGACST